MYSHVGDSFRWEMLQNIYIHCTDMDTLHTFVGMVTKLCKTENTEFMYTIEYAIHVNSDYAIFASEEYKFKHHIYKVWEREKRCCKK
jgi:hypothetical protein